MHLPGMCPLETSIVDVLKRFLNTGIIWRIPLPTRLRKHWTADSCIVNSSCNVHVSKTVSGCIDGCWHGMYGRVEK